MFSISHGRSIVFFIRIPLWYINFSDNYRKQKSAKHWLLSGLLETLVTHTSSHVDPMFPSGSMWCYMASSLIAINCDLHGILFLVMGHALVSISCRNYY
jgi:hypothetical protein